MGLSKVKPIALNPNTTVILGQPAHGNSAISPKEINSMIERVEAVCTVAAVRC